MVATASRSIKETLISKINDDNNLNIVFEAVSFDPPVMLDPTVLDLDDPTERNTSVRFVAGGDAGARVEATLKYNRLSLPKLFHLYAKNFPEDLTATSAYDLLPVISARIGKTLEEEDFEDTPITEVVGGRTFLLVAKTGSYVYFGQQTLGLGNPVSVGTITHDDSISALFDEETPVGDWTSIIGAQTHFLKLAFADGPEVAIKGYQFDRIASEDAGLLPIADDIFDKYVLPSLPEFRESLFQDIEQGVAIGIAADGVSAFEGYEYYLDYVAQFGSQSENRSYQIRPRTAVNVLESAELMKDLGTNAAPTYWDPDLKQYRIVVTDATPEIGFGSMVLQGGGVPLGSFAAAQVTINAAPVTPGVMFIVTMGSQFIMEPVTHAGQTFTLRSDFLDATNDGDALGSIAIAFGSFGTPDVTCNGLDVTIAVTPHEITDLAIEDVNTNLVFASNRFLSMEELGGNQSLVKLFVHGDKNYEPADYPVSGAGYPYGHSDVTLRVVQTATSTEYALPVRTTHTDVREAAAQVLTSNIFTNNTPTTPIYDGVTWPIAGDDALPIVGYDFTLGNSNDTVLGVRAGYNDATGSVSQNQDRPIDAVNGPHYTLSVGDTKPWYIDFVANATDAPLFDDLLNNTLELEIRPYLFDAEIPSATPGTPRTFQLQQVGDGVNIVCAALGVDLPLQYWDGEGNVIVGRIPSTLFGALIDADIHAGLTAQNSPLGYFRFVFKRIKAGVVYSKISCSALVEVPAPL